MRRDRHNGTVLGGLSDEAHRRVLDALRAGPAPDEQAMWIEITGHGGGAYEFDMSLRPRRDARPDDAVERHGELTVVIPADSVAALRGAEVLWEDGPAPGLSLKNPNTPPSEPVELPMIGGASPPASPALGARAPADLSGPTEQRLLQILEQQVNPAIAQHGGRADLVAVEQGTAYLRLSGGCQGCGMATVTLTQGIAVSITQAIPEIKHVVDVTDHAAGANPYYEAAKK